MRPDRKTAAKGILDNYLEVSNCRKTAERYAILSAAYDMGTSFSIASIGEYLKGINMTVSVATLYNTLALLEKLQLVVCHRLGGETLYEASLGKPGAAYLVCTSCGSVRSISAPAFVKAIAATKVRRFRKTYTDVVIYGVCSKCQMAMTRLKAKSNVKQNK